MHFKIQTEKDGRMMNLKGRNFLKLMDYTPEEILYLIDLAADLKKKKKERKKKPGHPSASLLIKIFCYPKLMLPLIVI